MSSLIKMDVMQFIYVCMDFVCFQVEPNTKLFPAVFARPTSANLFQFEFVKIKVSIF